MKRSAAVLAPLVVLLAATVLLVPQAASAHWCGQRWGSLEEHVPRMSAAQVVDIRTGRHACFDRLVLDVDGPSGGYRVRYVDVVVQDGSGRTVPVRGGARLQVTAHVGVIPTDSFFRPNGELADVRSFRTFRHLAWVGSFEGHTTVGLGVRARLPFRVFLLDGPGAGSRMVVDVAHRW